MQEGVDGRWDGIRGPVNTREELKVYDPEGYELMKHIYPEKTLAVFVKPPSIEELKIRLKKRKTESEDKINMRVAKASIELATAPQFDFIIENNNLQKALDEAYNLVSDFLNADK